MLANIEWVGRTPSPPFSPLLGSLYGGQLQGLPGRHLWGMDGWDSNFFTVHGNNFHLFSLTPFDVSINSMFHGPDPTQCR
jgi:hypothetical protein